MENLKMIKPEGVQGLINKFCYVIGNIPTSYKLGVTIEEQIIGIGEYLETKVYPALNNNALALAELQELFVQLKNYVQNYFSDLDIEAEIDAKLDEMLENGTLSDIIENYVDYCYIIKEIEKVDLYNENGKTNLSIFHIPNKDSDGNDISLKHGFSNDVTVETTVAETPTEFSKRKNATLVTNASIYDADSQSSNFNKIMGLIIHEGVVVSDTREFYPVPRYRLGRSLYFRT